MFKETSELWTDAEWQEFGHWLKQRLTEQVSVVSFTKKDGSFREMTCSLRQQDLPPPVESAQARTRKDTTLSVFDVKKNEWRSFIVKNVLSVKTIEEIK